MIFTKYGNDKFYIKADKLSPLVIMGYLMSSFNFKFVTQWFLIFLGKDKINYANNLKVKNNSYDFIIF